MKYLSFIFICISLHVQAQVDHWEMAVFAEDTWSYFDSAQYLPWNWNDVAYDVSDWKTGPGGFGFGDGDDNTITRTGGITVYSRIDFEISDLSKIAAAMLHFDFDDAIIIYLNGEEVFREGITDLYPRYYTPASSKHEAKMHSSGSPYTYELPESYINSYLQEGTNTLAVEVHNISEISSDLSSIVYLSLGISDPSTFYRPVPDWFPITGPIVSNIPLVIIDTESSSIPKDQMIDGRMRIVNNGVGEMNHIDDIANEYYGFIGIRVRGNVSSAMPQQPYRIETRDALLQNRNMPLLGMPEENDWALINNYKDRTFLKHSLGYYLSREMGIYAPRTKHCEVVLNGQSQGIYMLTEVIKRDKNRVDIAKLRAQDTIDEQLTGGYIFKVDYFESDGSDSWEASYQPPHNPNPVHFVYSYPEAELISLEQAGYIEDFVSEFESVLYSEDFRDPLKGYRAYINVPSFINYLLIQEVALNNDGYKKSCHFFKDKDSCNIRSFLNAGPVWDMDWGWRFQDMNSTDPARGFLTGLEYNRTLEELWPTPVTWMPRLMEDPQFANEVRTTYMHYRESVLSEASMFAYMDSVSAFLGDAKKTHYKLWHNESGNMDTYYDEQLDDLKEFISWRLDWLDQNLPGEVIDFDDFLSSPYTYIDSTLIPGVSARSELMLAWKDELRVYPTLVNDFLHIQSQSGISAVSIFDYSGVLRACYKCDQSLELQLNMQGFKAGMYFVVVENSEGVRCSKRVVKN